MRAMQGGSADACAVLASELLEQNPAIHMLVLQDKADPGFPSFPVIRSSHYNLFGTLLPPAFLNQDGDPFLFELYRCCGGVLSCMDVTVINSWGKTHIYIEVEHANTSESIFQSAYKQG